MGGATLASALSAPLADRLGSWQGSLASWTVLALVGLVVWLPFTLRANPHHTPGEEGPGRLPRRHRTAWLLAGYLALQSWCFYSAVTWLPPTYVELGWAAAAGYLGAAFSGAQIVSGGSGPVSDRIGRPAPVAPPVGGARRGGLPRCLDGPWAAPWVWALVIGFGQGSAFSLALVLLVRYAVTPAASGRLTGMAFLFSYGVASIGPLSMGLVRDVTGGLSPVWLVLVLVGILQALVVLRLRPGPPQGRLSRGRAGPLSPSSRPMPGPVGRPTDYAARSR